MTDVTDKQKPAAIAIVAAPLCPGAYDDHRRACHMMDTRRDTATAMRSVIAPLTAYQAPLSA